jgi:hypothetical protein
MKLSGPLQDDLGPPIVALHFAFDLDLPALQPANIAHLLQVPWKDDDRKRAKAKVLAEVKEMHAAVPELHVQNFSTYTASRTDVLLGVFKSNALCLACDWTKDQPSGDPKK